MKDNAEQKATCPRLRALVEPLRPYYREALCISGFTNLLALAVPLFTLQVYDRVVAHNGTSTLVALSLGVLLALAFDFLLRQSRSRLLQNVALHIDAKLGRMLYDKLTALPLRLLESRPASYWQGVYADMAAVRGILSGPSAVMVLDIPFALLFVLVVFLLAPSVAWVLLLIIPAFLLLTWASGKALAVQTAKEIHRQHSRESLIAELVAGRTTVKALMIDKAMQPEFEALHAETIRQSHARGTEGDRFIALGQSLSQLATVAVVVVGAMAIIDRDLTIGALIATTMLTGRIIQPLNQLLASWKQFAAAREAALRLERLLEAEEERTAPALRRPRPKGEITLEQVGYRYSPDDAPTVHNISGRLEPGQLIGLAGRNGCGKTTLVKLLLGLYVPDSGRVLLDGADIQQFSRAELAEWIGYVPQESFLFSGTVRENIAKAHPQAEDDAILAAARLSGATAFINHLPHGYDTQVGEGGHRLSGGQRQSLAIARALLRDPPVLLLDEASSQLDSNNEAALAQTLQTLKEGRCILLVTHSPRLLAACDRILVMNKGELALSGPAKEVMAVLSGKGGGDA